MPAVVTTADELRAALHAARRSANQIGFVPTMGALHAGHAGLIDLARSECDFVVVSIFVNPTQFGPNEDWARYPRPFDDDLKLCSGHGVGLVFRPSPEVIYPPKYRTFVEVHGLQDGWEGRSRPGHFRGVATVVLKLLNLVRPERAYFGQKDAQQVAVVRSLIADLNVPVELRVGATVREADGLALSSRNRYLNPEQRRDAAVVYRALTKAAERAKAGGAAVAELRSILVETVSAVPAAKLDYADVVSADTFDPIDRAAGRILILLAVWFGSTRLIDNLVVELPD